MKKMKFFATILAVMMALVACEEPFDPNQQKPGGDTPQTEYGKGTEAEPFLIRNLKELKFFRDHVNAGKTKYNAEGVHVALAANIDMAAGKLGAKCGFHEQSAKEHNRKMIFKLEF